MPMSGLVHGAIDLPLVRVDSYNVELRDREGCLGDRANKRALRTIIEDTRERLRATGSDPLESLGSQSLSKRQLDRLLAKGQPEAAALIHGAIEDFAGELARVVRRFLAGPGWQDTRRIVVGGGLRDSRIGELAIGRAELLLRESGEIIDLAPIRNHPDEAGLIGAVHLAPPGIFEGHDSILAVDIGGTNIRVGIVRLRAGESADLARAMVEDVRIWRHRDTTGLTRDEAVARLVRMLEAAAGKAGRAGLSLAPFIGIACPGLIAADGRIARGGHNLPGDWHAEDFLLPEVLHLAIPAIGGRKTRVVVHNDAVVQGLSEAPWMEDAPHWGVLTIGTGLGNARFTNKERASREDKPTKAL